MRLQERYSHAPGRCHQSLAAKIGFKAMPSTKSYRQLHQKVAARPGAARRLAGLRKRTLAEMKEHKFRQADSRALEAGSDHRRPVGWG